MNVLVDIIVTLITCFMIVGITWWGYSSIHARRSIANHEMLDEERNIQRLAKSFADMGCSANEATEAIKKLQIGEEKMNDTWRFVLEDGSEIIKRVGTVNNNKPKTTNCPNCGAPVDIHAEKCAYCDTPYI